MNDVLATRPARGERDEQAFRSFFVADFPLVLREVADSGVDEAAADAATREAFVRLLLGWRRVRLLGRPGPWVRQRSLALAARHGSATTAQRVVRTPDPTEVSEALAAVEATADLRRTRRHRLLAGIASVGVLVVAGVVTVSIQTSDPAVRPQPLIQRRSTELGPPPWVTEPSFARAEAIAAVYEPSPLDGRWISRPLQPAEVRRLLPGEPDQARVTLRLVVRSTALSLWVGAQGSADQRLLSYESFGTAGHRITASPVGHSTWHTTYNWRIDDERLRLTTLGSQGSGRPEGDALRRGLHTTAAFARR